MKNPDRFSCRRDIGTLIPKQGDNCWQRIAYLETIKNASLIANRYRNVFNRIGYGNRLVMIRLMQRFAPRQLANEKNTRQRKH